MRSPPTRRALSPRGSERHLETLPAHPQHGRALPDLLDLQLAGHRIALAQHLAVEDHHALREGDAVTNELQIEQIRQRSAVLRVRGQRFEMPF